MRICKVVGHVWATKKEERLKGLKLMIVESIQKSPSDLKTDFFVAADMVGAGVDELVLVVNGSTARTAAGEDGIPVDSAIIGIIDSMEVDI